MRLLLLFLFCYFVYRYGRYLFTQFQPAKPQQTTTAQQQTAYQSQTTAHSPNKKNDDEGEYVDFEEIK